MGRLALGLVCVASCLGLVASGEGGTARKGPGVAGFHRLELNALDPYLSLFDFQAGRLGSSRQFDESLREYAGDVLFTGKSFFVLETDKTTGTILDLGKVEGSDSEFGLFHGLRLWKRKLQIREFPFQDRFVPYDGLDATAFFSENLQRVTTVDVELGHVYIVRLFHRTRVAADRVFLVKTIRLEPGVCVEALWRELEDTGER